MSIGNINLASTPCCGLISRSYECYPDSASETGFTHAPGGDYSPSVDDFPEWRDLKAGLCPDCNKPFDRWIDSECKLGFAIRKNNELFWNYSRAQETYNKLR